MKFMVKRGPRSNFWCNRLNEYTMHRVVKHPIYFVLFNTAHLNHLEIFPKSQVKPFREMLMGRLRRYPQDVQQQCDSPSVT